MSLASQDSSVRRRRVTTIRAAIQQAIEAGEQPDPQQLLREHPDLATELEPVVRSLTKTPQGTTPNDARTPPHAAEPITLDATVKFDLRRTAEAHEPDVVMPLIPLPVGQARIFGNYELLAEIARGGMGIVYQARQTQLNRIVAVKMILAGQLAGEEAVRRFRTEAEAAAQLQHPNIVGIHEIGEYQGQHYFSMDYIDGTSLAALLRENALDPLRAAECVKTIAEAVEYAHSMGVLHRDLKPSNVLMQRADVKSSVSHSGAARHSGSWSWAGGSERSLSGAMSRAFIPKLTDFGLAKRLSPQVAGSANDRTAGGGSEATVSGTVLGTPSYMPPEQASSQLGAVGPRSDVYSIGAILYETLTGRPPFRAASPMETMWQVIHSEPAPPRVLNAAVPRDLETICLKCLSKEPSRRYGSAQELADELQRFLNGEPILARPIGTLARTWRWCLRNRVVASLSALVFLLLIAFSIGATIAAIKLHDERDVAIKSLSRAEHAEKEARQQRNAAVKSRDRARRAEADATEKLWGSYLSQARAGRWSGRAGRRFESLDVLGKAAAIRPAHELRDEVVACLALPDVRVVKQWKLDPPPPNELGCSLDAELKCYATFDAAGTITIRSVTDQAELSRLPGPGSALEWTLRFSPNGHWLAAKYRDQSLRVWDLSRCEPTLTVATGVSLGAIDFSSDSSRIAVGDASGEIHIHDTEHGTELRRFRSLPNPYSVKFHPQGKLIAVSSHQQTQVEVIEVETGKSQHSLAHGAGVRGLAWRPDGMLLASACANGRVYVWELPAARAAMLHGHTTTVTHVMFNHAGSLLASYGWDGETRLWDPVTQKLHVRVPGEVLALSQFSPDDRFLPFRVSAMEVGIWEVNTAAECRTLGRGTAGDFSEDARWLTATDAASVSLWHVPSGRIAATIPVKSAQSAHFIEHDSALLISSDEGLTRRSVKFIDGERVELGDPASVLAAGVPVKGPAFPSASRRWLAINSQTTRAPLRIDLQNGSHRVVEGTHAGHDLFLAIHSSGRWLASGTWKGTGVKIWDVETAQMAIELPVPGNANVLFSPDDNWLVTGNADEFRFWDVGTWQPRHAVPRDRAGDIWGRMACSPDGKLLAVAIAREGGLQLISAGNGHTLTKLDAPLPQTPACFSANSKLLAVNAEGGVLQVWNLQLVRERLHDIHLDWR